MKIFLASIMLLTMILPCHAQYDKEVFFFRGRQNLADGHYAQAIENFNILTRLDTTDYWTYFYRGIAKYNLGDLRGANQDFNTSIGINPVFTSGYHYRAITQSRFGRYDDALEDLETAISLRPGTIGLYYSRGVTYFLSQRFGEAVKDFDRYIRKEPKDPSAYLNRGATYLYLGDTLKAFADYNKAIRLDRFDPEGYIRRGRLYASQENYADAIEDMNHAIDLDSSLTFAYFNRAIMRYEQHDYNGAMTDLNKVLEQEPGNALTLYNRGLINAQVGDYEAALSDLDRVLNINPENVLAYFNRASVFAEMGRWRDALEDYDSAIDLYPDFAKAYMNRSYVENMLGDKVASKRDYNIANQKIQEYRNKNLSEPGSFADTTKKYSSLLALDADFAKKDFDDELLQHRDIDIRLKPMYRHVLAGNVDNQNYALARKYENPLLERFGASLPAPSELISGGRILDDELLESLERMIYSDTSGSPQSSFQKAMLEAGDKRFNNALAYYDKALSSAPSGGVENLYRVFYLNNRAALRADIIEFISSMESNVQVLTMDDSGSARTRVADQVDKQYDYSEAIADLKAAIAMVPDLPYLWFNLGNLSTLSSDFISSVEDYSQAIRLYPYMGDAYYNRGLVLIYLKDKEKGCIDLSMAGELGVDDAYSVIKKYCEEGEE
ncbi:MAG: tetratricopeptide repeat protein [Bacteroidales bacterium]|nr:tetratricopeptide repeat protein [Bacteroidales bacterium]